MGMKSCFISAPAGTDLSQLRLALDRRGIRWFDQSQLRLGESIATVIREAINSSDFLCAIFPKDTNSANVLYELGMAMALEKPVLAFVESDRNFPVYLQGLPYARASISDSDALSLHLDSFLRFAPGSRERKAPTEQPKTVRAGKEWTQKALDALDRTDIVRFERMFYELFEEAGLAVSSPSEKD